MYSIDVLPFGQYILHRGYKDADERNLDQETKPGDRHNGWVSGSKLGRQNAENKYIYVSRVPL